MKLEKITEFYGTIISTGVAEGNIYDHNDEIKYLLTPKGDGYILFCKTPSRDVVDLLYSSVGLITYKGGLMSHIAIVSRELGIPYIIVPSEKLIELINTKKLFAKVCCEGPLNSKGKLELFLEDK